MRGRNARAIWRQAARDDSAAGLLHHCWSMSRDATCEFDAETEIGLYRADSDPDADEAYGGPTKVGSMSRARIAQMMMAAEKRELERIYGSTRYSSSVVSKANAHDGLDEQVEIPSDADTEADSASFEPTLLAPTVERESASPRPVDPQTTAHASEQPRFEMIEIREAQHPYLQAPRTYPSPMFASGPRQQGSDIVLALQIALGVFAFLVAAVPALYFLFRL